MTIDDLRAILPHSGRRVDQFFPYLESTMQEFHIDSAPRQAAFIAQLAHESGEFRYVQEIASGDAYEGRRDLGNTEPGDGRRFKGRGLIQVTGRDNYRDCGHALGLPLLDQPDLLEQPEHACRSAGWFWASRGLNEKADMSDFLGISIKINGRNRSTGLPNGWSDRLMYWGRAKMVLGV